MLHKTYSSLLVFQRGLAATDLSFSLSLISFSLPPEQTDVRERARAPRTDDRRQASGKRLQCTLLQLNLFTQARSMPQHTVT